MSQKSSKKLRRMLGTVGAFNKQSLNQFQRAAYRSMKKNYSKLDPSARRAVSEGAQGMAELAKK
jgi:hypothetical protein